MELPIYHQLIEAASCASQIYPVSGLILYCLCGWIASDLFQLLLEDMTGKECENISLQSLKMRYQQACRLIDNINECFGCVMLIFITYTMASACTVCFAAVVEFQHYDKEAVVLYARDTALLVQHFIHLAIITYIPLSLIHI